MNNDETLRSIFTNNESKVPFQYLLKGDIVFSKNERAHARE